MKTFWDHKHTAIVHPRTPESNSVRDGVPKKNRKSKFQNQANITKQSNVLEWKKQTLLSRGTKKVHFFSFSKHWTTIFASCLPFSLQFILGFELKALQIIIFFIVQVKHLFFPEKKLGPQIARYRLLSGPETNRVKDKFPKVCQFAHSKKNQLTTIKLETKTKLQSYVTWKMHKPVFSKHENNLFFLSCFLCT